MPPLDHGGGQGGAAAHLGGLPAPGLRHAGGGGRQTAVSGPEAESGHRPGPGQVGHVTSCVISRYVIIITSQVTEDHAAG